MSGVDYFSVEELNPYSHASDQPDNEIATREFLSIKKALESSGVKVIKTDAPKDCQDGIYTANWGLCRGDKVVLSSLVNKRQPEQATAKKVLRSLGKTTFDSPYPFSGQGDALPCGNLLFIGQTYRTDQRIHKFIADKLGFKVISLQTIPLLDEDGVPVVNRVTGFPDSYFYDLDLALSVLTPSLIAWCPEAFTVESQTTIRQLDINRIEVSLDEALKGFACNLVSTGETVVMSNHAPQFKSEVEAHGLKTITPEISELAKGGGYIRCTTLTLDN